MLPSGGGFFVQFGRRPVKFIFWAKKGETVPVFFWDGHWKICLKVRRLWIGYTTRPKEIGRIWKRRRFKSWAKPTENAHLTIK